jgi:hypothetical protein
MAFVVCWLYAMLADTVATWRALPRTAHGNETKRRNLLPEQRAPGSVLSSMLRN